METVSVPHPVLIRLSKRRNGERLLERLEAIKLPSPLQGLTIVPKKEWEDILVDLGMRPSRGLGDTIAKVTSAIGIKQCGKCKRRRAKLNKVIPFKSN